MFDDFWPFQHLEMAVPVTELIPQQLGYFERGSAHTLELRSIYPLKDNRRGAMEKKLVYIVYSCHTGDFGPWALPRKVGLSIHGRPKKLKNEVPL